MQQQIDNVGAIDAGVSLQVYEALLLGAKSARCRNEGERLTGKSGLNVDHVEPCGSDFSVIPDSPEYLEVGIPEFNWASELLTRLPTARLGPIIGMIASCPS
jgi:hypothetical protein